MKLSDEKQQKSTLVSDPVVENLHKADSRTPTTQTNCGVGMNEPEENVKVDSNNKSMQTFQCSEEVNPASDNCDKNVSFTLGT